MRNANELMKGILVHIRNTSGVKMEGVSMPLTAVSKFVNFLLFFPSLILICSLLHYKQHPNGVAATG